MAQYELHIPAQKTTPLSSTTEPDFKCPKISEIRITLTPFHMHDDGELAPHDLGFVVGHLTNGGYVLSRDIVPRASVVFGRYSSKPCAFQNMALSYNVLGNHVYRELEADGFLLELSSKNPNAQTLDLSGDWKVSLGRVLPQSRRVIAAALQQVPYSYDSSNTNRYGSLVEQTKETCQWFDLETLAKINPRY